MARQHKRGDMWAAHGCHWGKPPNSWRKNMWVEQNHVQFMIGFVIISV